MIHGRDIILSLDGVPVAAAKSCSIDLKRDMIEVASPVSGAAKSFIPGTYGWTGSLSLLVAGNMQLLVDAVKSGRLFDMKFVNTDRSIHQYGKCYIDSCSISAEVGSLAKGSIGITGSGELLDHGAQLDLSLYSMAEAEECQIQLEDDGSWSTDRRQEGSMVINIPIDNIPLVIESVDNGPAVVLKASGTSASSIANNLDSYTAAQRRNMTIATIKEGESVFVQKGSYQYFLVVNDAENYADNCKVYVVS